MIPVKTMNLIFNLSDLNNYISILVFIHNKETRNKRTRRAPNL